MKQSRFSPWLHANQNINPHCVHCTNADGRKVDAVGLCKVTVSTLDNLPVRCVGEWANDKIYYLIEYFKLFAGGMKKKWGRLRYVEICSGPGRCILREKRKEQDGSALCILNSGLFKHITEAIFVDYSDKVVHALNKRIDAIGKSDVARAVQGDYNDPDTIVKVLQDGGANTLTLCFIDPTDCSVPFDTIRRIKKAMSKCDFIISVFDGLDFHRNAAMIVNQGRYPRLREKYLRFLGDSDFFDRPEVIAAARSGEKDVELSRLFRECYSEKLRSIGLLYQGSKRIRNLYYLQFASGHERGLDFWNKAVAIDRTGQAEFGF